ncbi:pyruvoyl-dependent arginine decarboxylase [Halococcus qingdaonensis]|uniref:pyruvoyl-dependent arginine decarboxylase n=1 Tax=Halococcus qingdaonensis TaxID=224402 RepID=UPI0021162F5C|nr:pyruvoyl-dependent arginine decarboxylase [Halococcus qingdaonensis]
MQIRIVTGTGTGPTPIAAYDAALAAAGVHNYNITTVSSVIPDGSTLEIVDSAPDLGPVGERLTVVEARATSGVGESGVAAGLGWTTTESDRGLFYEATDTDPESVREGVAAGLDSGRALREWTFTDERIVTEHVEGTDGSFATALVLGIYGDSEPI